MKAFSLQTEIHSFTGFAPFVEVFRPGQGDLILTHRVLYELYMRPLALGCDVVFQEDYGSEPTDTMIDLLLQEQSGKNQQRIFAIGGGSVIDLAKILALGNVTTAADLFERRCAVEKQKKLVAIPTTCGTGSEVTNITIALFLSENTKLGLVDDALYPDCAVLIPELLKSLPYKPFIHSSIDALVHALESYLSPKANSYTELYSLRAIDILVKGYQALQRRGRGFREEILEDFLLASNFAGIAFAHAGVGAVHALSYPLSGKYRVPHGEANYLFLGPIFKAYERLAPEGKIKRLRIMLASLLGLADTSEVFSELEWFLSTLQTAPKLRDYGMMPAEIETFVDIVMTKQQRLLANNYVFLSRDEIRNIYRMLH